MRGRSPHTRLGQPAAAGAWPRQGLGCGGEPLRMPAGMAPIRKPSSCTGLY